MRGLVDRIEDAGRGGFIGTTPPGRETRKSLSTEAERCLTDQRS